MANCGSGKRAERYDIPFGRELPLRARARILSGAILEISPGTKIPGRDKAELQET